MKTAHALKAAEVEKNNQSLLSYGCAGEGGNATDWQPRRTGEGVAPGADGAEERRCGRPPTQP